MFKYIVNYFLLNLISGLIPHPKLRAAYLKILGAKIGKNVRIEKVFFIQVQNSIKNLCCKDNSFIGSNVILDLSSKIILDEYAAIAPGCTILTHQDFGDFNGNILSTIYKTKFEDVHLEKNAIISADSTITPGVKIGKNSIVGAKSLVNSNVPTNVLAIGIPVKVIAKHGFLLPVQDD